MSRRAPTASLLACAQPGKLKNTVVFQRDDAEPVFVKADAATGGGWASGAAAAGGEAALAGARGIRTSRIRAAASSNRPRAC
jgi:hypothetical protein